MGRMGVAKSWCSVGVTRWHLGFFFLRVGWGLAWLLVLRFALHCTALLIAFAEGRRLERIGLVLLGTRKKERGRLGGVVLPRWGSCKKYICGRLYIWEVSLLRQQLGLGDIESIDGISKL